MPFGTSPEGGGVRGHGYRAAGRLTVIKEFVFTRVHSPGLVAEMEALVESNAEL